MFIMFHVLPFYLFWIWCFVFYHSGLSFRCSVSRICSVFRVVFRILPQLYERAKMVQNDKQLCLLCSISLEPYIVWLSFMVHKCYAMIISPGIFFLQFFKILIFCVVMRGGGKGGERAKNCPKWQQILSVTLHIIIWSSFMLDLYKVTISSSVFFNFWKFWFSGLLVVYKCKKWYKMTKNYLCRAPYLRNHTWYDCHLW